MNIERLVREVEEVFLSLDKEISDFKQWSGLHCKVGCGKCCLKPDIEATILEFLPFAHQLYKEGNAIKWLENPDLDQSLCSILDTAHLGAGHCSSYATRGLICRLFGFSARLNKYGHREFVTCQVIKTELPTQYNAVQAQTIQGRQVPLMRDYYMKLHGIDWELSQKFYPVNTAIKKAIETVLHHYSYREDMGVTIS